MKIPRWLRRVACLIAGHVPPPLVKLNEVHPCWRCGALVIVLPCAEPYRGQLPEKRPSWPPYAKKR